MKNRVNVKSPLKGVKTVFDGKEKTWTALGSNENRIYPPNTCLGPAILDKLRESDPNRLVEFNYDNGYEMRAQELRNNAITCAINLERIGVGRDDVVVFFTQLSTFTTSVVFGCYIVGAVVNPFETSLNEDDRDYVLELLDPTIILYDEEYKDQVMAAVKRAALPKLRHIWSFGPSSGDQKTVHSELLLKTNKIDSYQAPKLGDPLTQVGALLLTSGTTGKPKAIIVSHAHLLEGFGTWWSYHDDTRIFIASPFRWVSQISAMLQEIFMNVTRVYTREAPTAALCCDLLRKGKVNNCFTVPTVINQILEYAEKTGIDCLDTMEIFLAGGECFSSALLETAERLIPNCALYNGYGMTELVGCICSNELLSLDEKLTGQIVPGLNIRICQDDMKPVGPNINGHICIKPQSKFLGYLKNTKANQESFFGDNWFITGDYGYVNEKGNLRVFGRYKDLIQCDGNLIIPTVVDSIISKKNEINSIQVIGVPHAQPDKGQMVAIFIKLSDGIEPNQSLKKDILRDLELNGIAIGNIKGIFFRNSFQLTSCGKVDKVALKNSVL